MSIVFQALHDNEIETIRKQLQEKGRSDIKVVGSEYNGHIDEKNVEPNKEFAFYLDCAQNVSSHGFHYDLYTPPRRTVDPDESKALLAEAKEPLLLQDLDVTLDEEFIEEITRENYDIKIKELKDSLRKPASDMAIEELGASIRLSRDPLEIITYAAQLMTIVNGAPISKLGHPYSYTPDWLATGWIEAFENPKYDEKVFMWTKALKTRCRNIIIENKNFNAIKFFIDFLIEKYNEESYSVVQEAMDEKTRLNEEQAKRDELNRVHTPDFEIAEEDIPF